MENKHSGPGRPRKTQQPPDALPGLEAFDEIEPDLEPEDAEDLMGDIRAALKSKAPLDLLALASGLISIVDPRSEALVRAELGDRGATSQLPRIADMVDPLIADHGRETTAVLTVMRSLARDDLVRTRITRELARRKHKLPRWLTSLEYVRAEPEVWRISHLLGDDDTYIVGATLPTADHLTAVLYVDQVEGATVDDAVVAPAPAAEVLENAQIRFSDDWLVESVDPATARAILEEAIERGAHAEPSFQTDSWPMCRPLVEWLLRALPAGGSVPQHRQWTPQEISRLEQDFLASSLAAGMTDDRHREVLRQVLRYGTEHGTGDPLRWSLLRVAALMLEWYPLTVTAGLATMELLPGLLRAFVPYAHERSGIRPDLTDEVIASIEEDEPDYRQLIEAAPEDRAELRAELLAFDIPDDPDWLDDLEGLDGDDNFSGPVIELRDRTES